MRVTRFTFGGVAEKARDVGLTLDVRLLREVEVAAVRLRLARERVLQVLMRLRSFEILSYNFV